MLKKKTCLYNTLHLIFQCLMNTYLFPPQPHLNSLVPLPTGIQPYSPSQKGVMHYIYSPDGPASLLDSPIAFTNVLLCHIPKICLIWSTVRKGGHWILKLISKSGCFLHNYLWAIRDLKLNSAGNPFINCCHWYDVCQNVSIHSF